MSQTEKPAGRMAGRRALVTGAGSGIGRAVARLFHAEGAQVAALDLNGDAAAETAREVGGASFAVDVSNPEQVAAAVQGAAEALGGIDAVVNCAGIVAVKSLEETDPAGWQRMIGVNMTGPFLVCRAALPWLRQAPGRATIVNISSAQALRPMGASAGYAASKAGVLVLTKALASELAPGIRANVVAPGIVDTPMSAGARQAAGPDGKIPTLKDYALGRMGQPEEIASAILFLSCAESSFVTGATLSVDGGRAFH
jgi:NAD(P)-dependent dehydrogenase (short-subunit alcohol dehydrogenase family)